MFFKSIARSLVMVRGAHIFKPNTNILVDNDFEDVFLSNLIFIFQKSVTCQAVARMSDEVAASKVGISLIQAVSL